MGSIEISYSDTQTLSGFLAPRTGDSSNMFMFMVITGLSGIGLFTCVILNEKFSKKKKTVTQEN